MNHYLNYIHFIIRTRTKSHFKIDLNLYACNKIMRTIVLLKSKGLIKHLFYKVMTKFLKDKFDSELIKCKSARIGRDIILQTGLLLIFLYFISYIKCNATELSDLGLYVIPYPQQVTINGESFDVKGELNIILSDNYTVVEEFAANELVRDLQCQFKINARISKFRGDYSISLIKKKLDPKLGKQGYEISVDRNKITITASGEEGLFYGTQTLLQLIKKTGDTYQIPGLKIIDWPDVPERAVHYDTKHHQDKLEYVKNFIKELAYYKINILIWEWEDKFAYPSHPEIGAPGAFTPSEIRDITTYARNYHVQIVPLVQGLGHSSYILKWPQYEHLREVPASNFEFCPLKNGTYDLLFDLWKDAMDVTMGSAYLHIGSDETYELGHCDQCKKKAIEIGKKGLYHLFTDKAARFIISNGRKPMVWEAPMSWEKNNVESSVVPNKGLVLTEDDTDRDNMIDNAKKAKNLGYRVFFYDPNPGIEPLFLPYFFREEPEGRGLGCLEDSYRSLKKAALSGIYDGVIRTSWDDAGLHNQMWMFCFITAAAFSWNGHSPDFSDFKESYFKNYYGVQSINMEKLFYLMNEGAYYYWDSFERKVWHWGEIGKTFMPDSPRGNAVEFDPYWKTRYSEMINKSGIMLGKMNLAMSIIQDNRRAKAKHHYDFDLFESMVQLIRHTCMTYEDLSHVEQFIKEANNLTFIDRDSAYSNLNKAAQIVEICIKRRLEVSENLNKVWEQTRLPKGMSTNQKSFFFQQDRTRHFANRKPDMTYLIYDEQKLDMEGWLERFKVYMEQYKSNSFKSNIN